MSEIAIGVVTYNRPRFADKCLRSVQAHLEPLGFDLSVCNDGSEGKYRAEYQRAYRRLQSASIIEVPENQGVSVAKNLLLTHMLESTDAKWLFLLEDDILIQSPKAVTEYVRVAEATGLHHLSFAHHGQANAGGAVAVDGDVEFFPHSVGAWCLYSRESLEASGLFDEHFHNAWEHVEHELRLIHDGFMPGADAYKYPDVAGSDVWLKEIPDSIEKSSIRPRDDWQTSIRDGLVYWSDRKPETYNMLFGKGTPLEEYAKGVIGNY